MSSALAMIIQPNAELSRIELLPLASLGENTKVSRALAHPMHRLVGQ
jgi:hypothetical protein